MESFRVRVMRLTCMAGLGGLPQMNLPMGTVAGCPAGLSLIAWPGGDEALLDVAVLLARFCGIAGCGPSCHPGHATGGYPPGARAGTHNHRPQDHTMALGYGSRVCLASLGCPG